MGLNIPPCPVLSLNYDHVEIVWRYIVIIQTIAACGIKLNTLNAKYIQRFVEVIFCPESKDNRQVNNNHQIKRKSNNVIILDLYKPS